MASIQVTLPKINGEIEAELVVGTDPSLPLEDKRQIAVTLGTGDAVRYAAICAYDRWSHKSEPARSLYICAAAVAVSAGLCVKVVSRLDGDWVEVVATPERLTGFASGDALNRILTIDNYRKALSVIVACKANWLLCNHHTGQGEVQGYTKKVLTVLFTNNIDKTLTESAHTIGRWCSTIKILTIAGITGLVEVADPIPAPLINVTLDPDAKLRFGNFPAGNDRCIIAYESARRLIRSPLVKFCPGGSEFARISESRRGIIGFPSSYHIGASYLTGRARADYQDTENESYLGRLVTYIRVLFSMSTLANSPYISASRVDSYEDYSPEWFALLSHYRQMSQSSTHTALQELQTTVGSMLQEEIDLLRQNFFLNQDSPEQKS